MNCNVDCDWKGKLNLLSRVSQVSYRHDDWTDTVPQGHIIKRVKSMNMSHIHQYCKTSAVSQHYANHQNADCVHVGSHSTTSLCIPFISCLKNKVIFPGDETSNLKYIWALQDIPRAQNSSAALCGNILHIWSWLYSKTSDPNANTASLLLLTKQSMCCFEKVKRLYLYSKQSLIVLL